MEMEIYCVWPDYTICLEDELDEMLLDKSDDFLYVYANSEEEALEASKSMIEF